MFDSGVTATTTGAAAAAAASRFASSGFWTLYPLIFLLILMAMSFFGGSGSGLKALPQWEISPDPPPRGGGPGSCGSTPARGLLRGLAGAGLFGRSLPRRRLAGGGLLRRLLARRGQIGR